MNATREERRFGGLTVVIDRELCIANQSCIKVASELFVIDERGVVTFRGGAAAPARGRLAEACASCPVSALTLLDENGEQLAP